MVSAELERAAGIPRAGLELNRIVQGMLSVSIGMIAVLSVVFFCFAVPASDDYVRATGPTQHGWWHYVIGLVYFHWQGRWASCGLESAILPRVDITRFYGLLIGAVAMLDALGAYVLCRWFTAGSSRRRSVCITLALLALLWAGMPSLAESVYWFVGAVENAMVISLGVMLIVAVMSISKSTKRPGLGVKICGCCVAAIAICGFHELYGSMLVIALLTGLWWAYRLRGANRHVWLAVTLSASVGLAIVISAPGNSHRAVIDGGLHGRQLGYDIRVAASQALDFIPRWLANPRSIAASVWVAFSPALARRPNRDRIYFPFRIVFVCAWLAMLAVGFFAPSWAFGGKMPARTLSGIYMVFVIGWLCVVYLCTESFRSHGWPITPTAVAISNASCVLFAIALLAIGNAPVAVRDLHDRVAVWHTAVEMRFAYLRNQRDRDALVAPLPAHSPLLLLPGETAADPRDYRNFGMAAYFKLRSLRMTPQPTEFSPQRRGDAERFPTTQAIYRSGL
jgi:hypothetical protein